MRIAAFTIDLEPDCPPWLMHSWRGVTEGMPLLLELLRDAGVPATFFCTGEVAHRFPGVVDRLLADGHELGSHGWSHRPFPELTRSEARRELAETGELLRTFAPISTFRAPFLRFPSRYLPLLAEEGIATDGSLARYKGGGGVRREAGVLRVPASVTSSLLRLPSWARDAWVRGRPEPLVLFVHPWEFTDLRNAPIRWDCRIGTGPAALASVRSLLEMLLSRGTRFLPFTALAAASEPGATPAGASTAGGRPRRRG